ncbi:DUF6600 domain-containing protein [Cyclobacterium jeungdonense]|uniref:YXWGXW repeat-containing protein n=1 Tax=Cyclobacterium jeungdonense TaxID=708087 RepID=A0ABT8C259_9BACT|nr:DUF6600 domain-containing protein [Cyclobacterium jeungdonense]MDN3686570.1 hypothetical protein [Cyclobacterium jeungdonense]
MKTYTFKSSRLKKTSWYALLTLLILVFGINNNVSQATPVAVSFQVFYDELSPYGDWVQDPHYGYIWIPYAERDFQPYRTNGHWVMSTYGNTWVSNYDWGWAPFHYGRWFYSDFYGWAWIPDYEWGPAWVNWRTGRGYYGWFPLGPRTQFYASVHFPAYAHWVFVPRRRLLSRNIYRYYIPGRNVNLIYNQTTVINNTYVYNNQRYVAGPSRRELQQVTRRDVPVFEVREERRPGRSSITNNSIRLYRPEVQRTQASNRNQVVSRPKNYIPSSEYSARSSQQVRSERRATQPNSSSGNRVRSEVLRNNPTPDSRSANRSIRQSGRSGSAMDQSRGTFSPNRSMDRNNQVSGANETNRRLQAAPGSRNPSVNRRNNSSNPQTVRPAPSQPRVTNRPSSSSVQRQARPSTQRMQSSSPSQGRVTKSAPRPNTSVRRSAPAATESRNVRRTPAPSPTRSYQNNSRSESSSRVAPRTQRTQRSAPSPANQRSRRGN